MPTQSVLMLVDAVAEDTTRAGATPQSGALGAQAASIRALADEVDRHHPADLRIASLRDQLGEELARLAEILEERHGSSAVVAGDAAPPLDVLVVDDDDDVRKALVSVLRNLGYTCRAVGTAEDGLREYDREPAAIVLSDWCMPGMSGLELCAALKQHEPPPYVILATAFHENASLLDGMRGGADDFVRKPVDLDELEARLAAASRLIRAMRAVAALRARLESAPGT